MRRLRPFPRRANDVAHDESRLCLPRPENEARFAEVTGLSAMRQTVGQSSSRCLEDGRDTTQNKTHFCSSAPRASRLPCSQSSRPISSTARVAQVRRSHAVWLDLLSADYCNATTQGQTRPPARTSLSPPAFTFRMTDWTSDI